MISEAEKQAIVQPGQLYEVRPDGRWNFFFDNHMIKTFMDCEQKFKYIHIDRIRLKGGDFSASAIIGIWWSKALEKFYNAVAEWQKASLSQEASAYGEARPKVPDKGSILIFAAKAWDECKMEEWGNGSPKQYADFGGKAGAIAMAGEYYDSMAKHDLANWRVVSAESGFGRLREIKISENDKVVVYYIGKPDLTIVSQGWLIPVDHKTKDYIKSDIHTKFKPHNQMVGYVFSVRELSRQLNSNWKVGRVIVNVAARKEPSDNPRNGGKPKPRFARTYPSFSKAEIVEWQDRMVRSASRLRFCIENDEWLWNDNSCHLYAGCPYRRIDSLAPAVRPAIIKADYVQIEPWNPYKLETEPGEDEN